jgi:hypothetical protein
LINSYTLFFFLRRRRATTLKYLTKDDDHRQHLNASSDHHHRHPSRPIQIEHPHLLSTSPTIIPSLNHHRPNSSSSIINNDKLSDRESLLKQSHRTNATSTNIDNFYEEIKEQHQQINLDLGNDQYLEPKSFEDRKKFFDQNNFSQPIRDHREVFYYECEG